MAVVENGVMELGGVNAASGSSSGRNFRDDSELSLEKPKQFEQTAQVRVLVNENGQIMMPMPIQMQMQMQMHDQVMDKRVRVPMTGNPKMIMFGKNGSINYQNQFQHHLNHPQNLSNGVELKENGDVNGEEGDVSSGGSGNSGEKDINELVDILSKLNPMAEEFVPGSSVHYATNYLFNGANGNINNNFNRKKKSNYNQGKRRMNSRTSMAQREDVIRRTVYVSDIDQLVTEEQLAALFGHCGHVVDCRVCGDPNSVLRFAFIEFYDEEGAKAALTLAGTMLGYYPVRVLPSKTAIAPVNPTFLPRTEDEREMCARTIYCTNIDKKVSQADVKLFFESLCGEVYRLRLLGDYHHSTRIAFVEFVMMSDTMIKYYHQAESAINALNCSGAILGSLPIRVSPSKTPVRPRAPRPGPPVH